MSLPKIISRPKCCELVKLCHVIIIIIIINDSIYPAVSKLIRNGPFLRHSVYMFFLNF